MQHHEEYHRPLLKEIVLLVFFGFNVISATVTGNISVPARPIEGHPEDVLEQKHTFEQHFKLKL